MIGGLSQSVARTVLDSLGQCRGQFEDTLARISHYYKGLRKVS